MLKYFSLPYTDQCLTLCFFFIFFGPETLLFKILSFLILLLDPDLFACFFESCLFLVFLSLGSLCFFCFFEFLSFFIPLSLLIILSLSFFLNFFFFFSFLSLSALTPLKLLELLFEGVLDSFFLKVFVSLFLGVVGVFWFLSFLYEN